MNLSEEAQSIRRGLGEFLQELSFVDRRWIRIDSCSNNTFNRPTTAGKTKEVDCPLESFSDLLGITAEKANEFLLAAKLMERHKVHKTIGINKRGWDTLKSEFGLEIEWERISDIHYLGDKMYVMRIGDLCRDNPVTFNARAQAKRFFETAWKPKRLRATVQAKEFLSKTSLDLTIIMAKQQKELDEKERKEREDKKRKEREKDGGYDGDGDGDESEDDDDERKDDESFQFKSPAKSKSIEFNMNDARTKPIRWVSPNGKPRAAVCIPRTATRGSFRNSAKSTGWIENVTESMYNKEKIPAEVGTEWLIEAIFERHRPQFESFCERKGYMLPKSARMPKDKSAAMWTDGNVSYSVQRIINQHCYEHFRRWIFAKEEDVRGFGDTAMTPTIGVSTNEKGQHIFYWWKPPDEMLLHEINKMLNESNVRKLASVDFSTGGEQTERKKVKDECRAVNLERKLERVKDETIVTGHEAAKRKRVAGPSSLT
jgi:hypothetical protein